MRSAAEGHRLAELLGLEPLPGEGGLYRQTVADGRSSAIYFLLIAPEFSAMHRLDSPEVYHFYAGAPLRLLLLHPDGTATEPVLGTDLGTDLAAGQRPQLLVPAGVWQGSSSLGAWSLVGTTMAPPFSSGGFELGDTDALRTGWPAAADRVAQLCR
ncbi:MAG: cupin domain-containing protein [Streptosporangiales bacterium]